MKISQLQTTVELVKRNNTTRMLPRIASLSSSRFRPFSSFRAASEAGVWWAIEGRCTKQKACDDDS